MVICQSNNKITIDQRAYKNDLESKSGKRKNNPK